MSEREKHERLYNKQIENNVKHWLNKKNGYFLQSLAPGVWGVDWGLEIDGGFAFLEFRRRFIKDRQYPDYRLCAAKVQTLIELSKTYGLPSYFILQTNESLWSLKLNENFPLPKRLVWFGRNDKRDDMENDPAYPIPWGHFKLIHTGCVSDSLTDRPRGHGRSSLLEEIKSYGLNELRRLAQP